MSSEIVVRIPRESIRRGKEIGFAYERLVVQRLAAAGVPVARICSPCQLAVYNGTLTRLTDDNDEEEVWVWREES